MEFDADYYERFYRNPSTRATSPAEQQRQARFIASYLRYLEVPVQRIVDLGCGLGALLKQMQKAFPKATTQGVEASEYLCETYGWQLGSVVDYEDEPFDLVICTDVLGYLDDHMCRDALTNLTKLTKHALYLSVMTSEDLLICDEEHTDMSQRLRSHNWYRQALNHRFVSVGGGLFLRKPLE